MKSLLFKSSMLLFALALLSSSVSAQGVLRRLKEKTEEKIVNEIFREPENQQQQQDQDNNESNSNSADRRQNRRGTGLNQSTPDVVASITEAGNAFSSANYIQAKNAVKNALWGVELEIGRKVLETLPPSVEGMEYVKDEDKVSSTGAGFVGLVIERVYQGGDEMEVKATIGNDSGLLGMAGYYMTDAGYMQSTDQPDQKQIQFKEHRAVIRYDEYDGYTLSVPFGQSSVFMINGVNFENESQFMAAANTFDIQKIKKELGEQ